MTGGPPGNIVHPYEHSTEGYPHAPEDLVDELRKKVVLAPDEAELEAALDDLQSALQEHRDYLDSVAADYL